MGWPLYQTDSGPLGYGWPTTGCSGTLDPPPETNLENIDEKGLYHMKVYASVILRMYV